MTDEKDLPEAADTPPETRDPDPAPAAAQPDGQANPKPVHIADDKSKLAKLAKSARRRSTTRLILVPVDFSPHSAAALAFAATLADSVSAALLVLHVVHDPGEMPGYYTKLLKKKRVDRMQDIAREVFDDFMRRAIADQPEAKALRKADNLMVVGLPVTRILQVTEKVDPYMVVMGSQGRTGLKHLFLGSKAEQVVQLSPVPVTIVKHRK